MQQPGLLLEPAGTDVVRPAHTRDEAHQRRLFALATALVFAVALVARLGVILRKGGIHGIIGYDCGVYFSGADALLHGRLPYRDFTMVHPPGITLALAPFAALTHVMSDWSAFIIANVAFCIVGAVNALLVVLVCRRLGIARRGAVVAGLFYAGWFGSISAEFDAKLEPLGNFLLLLGLLALLRDQDRPRRWSAFAAGAVIGLPMAVKIWWVVPVLLIIAWHGMTRRSARAAVQALLGAATSVSVVCAPFFFADPSAMWRSVITGQLGRPRKAPLIDRLAGMSTIPELVKHLSVRQQSLTAVVFVVFVIAVVAFAWRGAHRGRFLIVVTLVQLGVLLSAPSWFEYYADYLAVGLAITVGGAVVAVRREALASTPAVALTAAMLVVTSLVTVAGAHAPRPYGGAAELTRAVRNDRCVMSNNPTTLLRLDALSRGLAAGCPNWIDITGRRMGPDAPPLLAARHRTWHGVVFQYLRSGGAVALAAALEWLPETGAQPAREGRHRRPRRWPCHLRGWVTPVSRHASQPQLSDSVAPWPADPLPSRRGPMLRRAPKAAFRPVLRPGALVLAAVLYLLGTGIGVWALSTGARHTGEFALDRTIAADRGTVLADVGRVIDVAFGPVVGPVWLLVLCLVLWRTLGRVVAARTGLLTLAGWFSIEVFKVLFHRHRPPTSAVHALVVETQPDSFPSGHTAFTASLVVALVVALAGHGPLRRVVLLVGIPFVMVVGASRLVVGAHYLADVVAAPILASAAIATAVGLGLAGRSSDNPEV